MTQYIVRRLIFGVVLIFMASLLCFVLLRASPGKVGATTLDDPRVSQAYLDAQRRTFGLDRSPTSQYLHWLGGLFHGDLGQSITYNQPVRTVIKSRLGATLSLNFITLFITWLVAIPLGIYAAVYQHRLPDRVVSLIGFVGMSMPSFFLALVLLWLFASKVQWLPPGGLSDLDHDQYTHWRQFVDYFRHLIVPVVVLTFGALAGLQRVMRGSMLETLRLQYVTTARAKGLSENRVVYKHALRNAINPLVTLLGFEFAALFGGAALMEIVLNYPGMGMLLLDALRAKDQFLVMSLFLIGSVLLVLGNLIAEILLAWVDPRVGYD
jgi:peptide/nickel transport system permease protein